MKARLTLQREQTSYVRECRVNLGGVRVGTDCAEMGAILRAPALTQSFAKSRSQPVAKALWTTQTRMNLSSSSRACHCFQRPAESGSMLMKAKSQSPVQGQQVELRCVASPLQKTKAQ